MNHWPFIAAAYGLVVVGAGGLSAWSFVAMRAAERRADAVTRR